MACKPFSAIQWQRDDPPGSSGGADPTTWTGTTADGTMDDGATVYLKFRFAVISVPGGDDCLGDASFQVSTDGGGTWSEWATKKNAAANSGGAGFGPWYLPGNSSGFIPATPGTVKLRLLLSYAGSQHVSSTIAMTVKPAWTEDVAPDHATTESSGQADATTESQGQADATTESSGQSDATTESSGQSDATTETT